MSSLSISPALIAGLLSVAAISACGDAPAAGDEPTERQGGVITLFSDSTELFMEHPALIVGQEDARFAVHLTDLTDFAPLRSGRITLRLTPRDGGEPVVVVQESPRVAGIYGPAPVFTRAGIYDLVIDVDSPQARDRIDVPGLVVYATAEDAPLDPGEEDAGIPFLKEQQWRTDGFRTAFPRSGTLGIAIEAPGEIIGAGERDVIVTAPAGGVLDAVAAPVVGARVRRGEVLLRLLPALGESGAGFADARARLREAEEEHERAVRLFAREAIPERRLHEARIELDAAREALAAVGGSDIGADGRIAIRAPLDGVIAERHVVAGARVDVGAPLFRIVDPSRVWLTAFVPSEQAAQIDRGAHALFLPEGADARVRTSRLLGIGAAVDPLTRAVRVTYEVANPDGSIRVGSLARVAVPGLARAGGLIIPSVAVLEDDGRPYVFVQTSGERYERRDVTLGGGDGRDVLVTAGLAGTDRVVIGAAYQVKLASLSSAVPTHGHEH